MKTDALITALSADAQSVSKPVASTLGIALVCGTIVAALAFYVDLGIRPDVVSALQSPRFLFKFVTTLTLLVSATGLVLQLARPGTPSRAWLIALATAPVLLALASIVELWVVPPSDWSRQLMGANAFVCLILIPALSAAPLAAMMLAMRQGATTHPVLAGAAAGLVSASVGATLYATHCRDDSPLFLAAWYVIAIAIVALVGALLGARLLRW